MDLREYQKKSKRTLNQELGHKDQVLNMVLGLNGEIGEVTDIFKKYYYQGHELSHNEVKEEIGDIMFYLVNLCNILGLELEEVLQENYDKLLKRYPEGFDEEKSINRSKEVENAYLVKHKENYKRQAEGY